MYVYLLGNTNKSQSVSAYCYRVSNFPYQTRYSRDWTVVEANLHGLVDLSTNIIRKEIYRSVTGFDLIATSQYIIKCVNTDYLEEMKAGSWKSVDGRPVFYIPLLEQLYFHRIFYKERGITWNVPNEVTAMEVSGFNCCRDHLDSYLERIK